MLKINKSSKSNPIVSVITVCKNSELTIGKTIKSVIQQSYKNIEFLIIDGKSSDKTVDIIKQFASSHKSTIKWLTESDSGMYEAINKGIKIARGEWIHLINSGDIYHSKTSLGNALNRGNRNTQILVNSIHLKNKGKTTFKWIPSQKQGPDYYHFPHPGLIIKRRFYNEHGLYDEKYKIISDVVWMIKYFPKSNYLILDNILIDMQNDGISTHPSLRLTYENILLTLLYRKIPPISKFTLVAKQVFRYFEYIFQTLIILPTKTS